MPTKIKKRPTSTMVRSKPKPKRSGIKKRGAEARKHAERCDTFYNRLQQNPKAAPETILFICQAANVEKGKNAEQIAIELASRVTTTISTFQCYSGKDPRRYEVRMLFNKTVAGMKSKPPSIVESRSNSHNFVIAVTLAYLQLCKRVGVFV